MPSNFSSENPSSLPTFVPSSITSRDPSQSPINKTSRFPPVVLSVYPYIDPRYAPSYVPSVNPSRSPNEKRIRDIKEERRTTLEQVKVLGNIISSRDIKVDEADQLRGLYIIKPKRGICMLKTNEHNFSDFKKAHIYFKKETKGGDNREEIKENAIRIISFQSKALKGHAEKLK